MVLGVLQVTLRLPSRDLKARRTIVRSVIERLRNRYNASVAEVGELNDPAHATIAVACLSNESPHADAQLQAIATAIQEWRLDAEILDIHTELLPFS